MAFSRKRGICSSRWPIWQIAVAVWLAAGTAFLGSCADHRAEEPAPGEGARVEACYDFLLHIDDARMRHQRSINPVASNDSSRPRIRSIDGQMCYSILAHPPSEISYRRDIHPGARLSFSIALDPMAQEQSVDGVVFEVYVREHLFKKNVFSHHLDPRTYPEPRGWKTFEVDLDHLQGKSVELIFRTGPGPQGNHDHDLAYWGEPRLLSRGRLVERIEPDVPHVFLVSLDTVRMDHLDLSGHLRCTAPHLNRLLGESILFTRARAPSHWTMPSHMSVLTSLTPDIHQVADPDGGCRLADAVPTMTELLKNAGYHTAGFATSDFLQGRLGFDRGFDHYELRQWNTAPRQNLLVRDWIETFRGGEGLFVFLHYLDAHSDWQELPYEALDGFDALFSGFDPDGRFTGCSPDRTLCASDYLTHLNQTATHLTDAQCRALGIQYDRGLRYLDFYLARLIAGLEELGVWDSSLVILFSDHGEEFQDHGMYLHSQLYEELLRVPLLIKLPGGRNGGSRVDEPVELLDLAPTVLSLLHLPVPETMQGRDLAPLIDRAAERAASRFTGNQRQQNLFAWSAGDCTLQVERWKMLFRTSGDGLRPHRLFDLEQDPGELVDLLDQQPEIRRRLERTLQTRLDEHRLLSDRLGTDAVDAREEGFSEEERARLESLGYVQ